MNNLTLFSQLWNLLEPLVVPIISVCGAFYAAFNFWSAHMKTINKIEKDTALTSLSLQHMKEDVKKIAKDVHQLKSQEHGVLNSALSQMEEMREASQEERKQFMEIMTTKFSEIDRKFVIVFNRQKRHSK